MESQGWLKQRPAWRLQAHWLEDEENVRAVLQDIESWRRENPVNGDLAVAGSANKTAAAAAPLGVAS